MKIPFIIKKAARIAIAANTNILWQSKFAKKYEAKARLHCSDRR
jgi:hypothetical protein